MRSLTVEGRPARGALIVVAVALVYCAWLGAHWLRWSYSSQELPMYASRIWDFETEYARSGRIPWWSSVFMNGSSEALPYAGDFPLVPWALLGRAFGLAAAGKLVALGAIGGAAVAMYFCARHLLRSEGGAILSALALLFHPLLLTRAAGTEHVSVVVFVAFLPLAWLFFARLLETGRFRDLLACATTLVLMLWTQNKQTLVQGLFFAGFAAWSMARTPDRRAEKARSLVALGVLSALLALFVLVPPLTEMKLVKLFEGDPVEAWQRMYSVPGVSALVDRRAGNVEYAGIVALALAASAMLFGRGRPERGLFWLIVGFEVAALALGLGPARPFFRIVALAPLFRDIRAPAVFWEVPGAFFGALLVGFFARDVLPSALARLKAPAAQDAILGALAVLLLVDAWPFQRPMLASDVPQATLDRARAMYAALGEEAAHEPGKVYVVGGRFFHLMGPSWGGPSLTTEAGLAFMGPRGSGRLAAAAGETLGLQRAYLDLVGARWLVFDKSDPLSHTPGLDAQLAAYRKIYPLDREDEDFAVFRVPHARPYVSGYRHAALAYGDARKLPELALSLAHAGYALVHADGERPEDARPESVAAIDAVYLSSPPERALAAEVAAKATVVGSDLPPLPPKQPREDAIADLAVTRDSAEHVRARFTADAECTAVIDESHYPFWRATLDGEPAHLARVAYGLMGVRVGPGPHELELTYRAPRSYGWSAMASLAALIAAIALALAEARGGRSR